MSNVILDRNVSDKTAAAAAKSLNISAAQRPVHWRARWEKCEERQREFPTAEHYSTFMEGLYNGSIRLRG